MRTGNSIDGLYFLLIIIPFVLSFWFGDLTRRKILSYLVIENYLSQSLSSFVGILAEFLIIITGIAMGLLLVRLL
jgi:hypothetical protein